MTTSPDTTPRPPRGFTVAELLTVIAAAGILLLLGLPSFARVHSRSEFAGCLGNQRQLMSAFLLYAQDHGDKMLGLTYQRRNGVRQELPGGGFWPGSTREILPGMTREEALETVRAGITNGPLWPFFGDASVFHCPGDPRAVNLRPGRGWAYDSYSRAEGMSGDASWGGIKGFRRVTDVLRPATSFVFCEEPDPRSYNRGTWILNVHGPFATDKPGWVDPLAAFHDGGANFAFLDGHVEHRRWQDPRTLRTARDSTAGFETFYASGGDASNPDFQWVWDRFQHAAWRPLQ